MIMHDCMIVDSFHTFMLTFLEYFRKSMLLTVGFTPSQSLTRCLMESRRYLHLSTQPTGTLPYSTTDHKHTSTSCLSKFSGTETLFCATEETEVWINRRLNGNEHLFSAVLLASSEPCLAILEQVQAAEVRCIHDFQALSIWRHTSRIVLGGNQ